MADIEALLAALTLEEKATLTAGRGHDGDGGDRSAGHSGHLRDRRSERGARARAIRVSAAIHPPASPAARRWGPRGTHNSSSNSVRSSGARRSTAAAGVCWRRRSTCTDRPLAGRNFECYSEDPLLSGRLASAYVRGVQSSGAFATVKHFVANEAEYERNAMSSVVDERSLRELYLVPFELAVREGGALAIMTAYNRLNGSWLTEQPRLPDRPAARRMGLRGPRHDRLVRRGGQQDLTRSRTGPRDAWTRKGLGHTASSPLVEEGNVSDGRSRRSGAPAPDRPGPRRSSRRTG